MLFSPPQMGVNNLEWEITTPFRFSEEIISSLDLDSMSTTMNGSLSHFFSHNCNSKQKNIKTQIFIDMKWNFFEAVWKTFELLWQLNRQSFTPISGLESKMSEVEWLWSNELLSEKTRWSAPQTSNRKNNHTTFFSVIFYI